MDPWLQVLYRIRTPQVILVSDQNSFAVIVFNMTPVAYDELVSLAEALVLPSYVTRVLKTGHLKCRKQDNNVRVRIQNSKQWSCSSCYKCKVSNLPLLYISNATLLSRFSTAFS